MAHLVGKTRLFEGVSKLLIELEHLTSDEKDELRSKFEDPVRTITIVNKGKENQRYLQENRRK